MTIRPENSQQVQRESEYNREKNSECENKVQLHTMLEKDMLLWKSFSSLENILSVESGINSDIVNILYTIVVFYCSEETVVVVLLAPRQ